MIWLDDWTWTSLFIFVCDKDKVMDIIDTPLDCGWQCDESWLLVIVI